MMGHIGTRESVADQIKKMLVRQITTGEIPPGTRLLELKLAKEFKTSQGPVREALRELEAIDLVSTLPYKGTYVREVSDEEVTQGYLVRASLEELAGRLAAPLLKNNVAPLRVIAGRIRDAAHEKDAETYGRFDMEFHRLIVEAAENRYLTRAWHTLSVAIRMRLWLVQGRIDMDLLERDHWHILDALEAGDSERSGALLRDHTLHVIAARRTATGS